MAPDTPESRLARLEERSQAILRDLDRLSRDVDAFGPMAGQIIEVIAEVRALTEDVMQMRTSQGMSTTIKVALISGCFLLAAALVAAVAQIVSALS